MSEHALCKVDDITPNSSKRFEIGKHRICVVRIGDDFYAIGDRCTHADISLSEGEILSDEREVECWKHGSTFSLKTGRPDTLPATKPVPVFDVRVAEGDVFVRVPE